MQYVEIVVVRPLVALGLPRAAASTLNVAPLVASQLIASGRAALVNAADQVMVSEAEVQHSLNVCRVDPSRRFRN